MTDTHDKLKALGSAQTEYRYDTPDRLTLERFDNPLWQRAAPASAPPSWYSAVEIVCPEFTSVCPKTGQPDFATIKINYKPDKWCVESKSLKLYLMQFRNFGAFHEECVQRIASDLVAVVEPMWLTVKGEFTPRGGIPFWPTTTYSR